MSEANREKGQDDGEDYFCASCTEVQAPASCNCQNNCYELVASLLTPHHLFFETKVCLGEDLLGLRLGDQGVKGRRLLVKPHRKED